MDSAQLLLPDLGSPVTRLARPLGPVLKERQYWAEDPGLLFCLARIWSLSRPPAAWLTLLGRPQRSWAKEDLETRRMTEWSYQLGYGGWVAFSLYPGAHERGDIVPWGKPWMVDGGLQRLGQLGKEAGEKARRLHCRHLILATGDLNEAQAENLEGWLTWFRTSGLRRAKPLCIGATEQGWPLPLSVSGRKPPAEITLHRWQWPNPQSPRRIVGAVILVSHRSRSS